MLRFFVLCCLHKRCRLSGFSFFCKTGSSVRVLPVFLLLFYLGIKGPSGTLALETNARLPGAFSSLEGSPSDSTVNANRRATPKEDPDALFLKTASVTAAPPALHATKSSSLSMMTVKKRGWTVSTATRQNHRGYDNQDQHIAIFPSFGSPAGANVPNVGIFAVFDGHGPRGDDASRIAKRVLMQAARDGARTMLTNLSTETDPPQVLDPKGVRAFIFDTYKRVAVAVNAHNRKTQSFSQTGGTTFSLVIWDADNEKLYVASAGDSIVLGGYEDRKQVEILSPVHAIDEELEEVRSRHAIVASGLQPVQKVFSEVIPGVAATVTVYYKRTPDFSEKYLFSGSGFEAADRGDKTASNKGVSEEDGDDDDDIDDDDDEKDLHVPKRYSRLEHSVFEREVSPKKADTPGSELPGAGGITDAESEEKVQKSVDDSSQPEAAVLSYSVTNKLWRGLGTDVYRTDASSLLEGVNSTYACFYSDTRIGGYQLSRSIGDNNKHHTDKSASFISAVPEIEEYDLKSSGFEYLLLTSDGFTDPFRLDSINSVYKSHVLDCKLENKTCLEDPVKYFNAWSATPYWFPDGFTTVTTALKTLALRVFRKEVYDVAAMASGTLTKAEHMVNAAYQKDMTACLTTHDDITVMYIQRKKRE